MWEERVVITVAMMLTRKFWATTLLACSLTATAVSSPLSLIQTWNDTWISNIQTTAPARRSSRPLANPDLFKPTPAIPKTSSEGPRKVSFQERPIDIADNSSNDLYRASPKAAAVLGKEAPLSSSATKQSKWQPLSTVDPSPIGEAENDPFSLGDSEDEKESKDRVGGKEIKMEDTERLKKKAEEAAPVEPSRKPEPAETVGTKDKIVEELMDKA